MAEELDAAEERKHEILAAIVEEYRNLPGLGMIGPLRGEKDYSCTIRVTKKDEVESLIRDQISVKVGDETLNVKLAFQEGSEIVLTAQPGTFINPPVPPAGPVLGGDAIWNDIDPATWGTVAFCASRIRIKNEITTIDVQSCALSCNHILALLDTAANNTPVSSSLFLQGFRLANRLPVTLCPNPRPVDAALAQIGGGAPATIKSLELRGLGQMARNMATGVLQIGNVNTNQRILKSGARTGITAGVDIGEVAAPAYGGVFYFRAASSGFACVHDSGSAVVDLNRKLVGLIVGGECGENCSGTPKPCGSIPGPISLYVPSRVLAAPLPANPQRLQLSIEATF